MPNLTSVTRLFDDGYHNAFTDILRWNDHYYVSYRTAQHHSMPPNGDVVIYRSADLVDWELCGRFDTGGDDRDPKLIDAGDRLGVVFGTWIPRWGDGTRSIRNVETDLISHVAVSRDGKTWGAPRQIYGLNYWMWRILSDQDGFYCAGYHFPVRAERDRRSVDLMFSDDLFEWKRIGQIRIGGSPGEPVLFRTNDKTLRCVIRTEQPDDHSWIGEAREPYENWNWTDLGVMIHAPVVLHVGDRWICAGRSKGEHLPVDAIPEDPDGRSHHTSVWDITDSRAEHILTVPSAGDCSYCGLAHGPDGDVVMSYYSQHERFPLPSDRPTPADVYLARFTL